MSSSVAHINGMAEMVELFLGQCTVPQQYHTPKRKKNTADVAGPLES